MARKKSLIAPLSAVVAAGMSGIIAFSLINSNETKATVQAPPPIQVEAPTVLVLVATNDIMVGKKISVSDLAWRKWPEALLNKAYITQNQNPDYIDKLIGGVTKIPIISGEPIVAGKIIQAQGRGVMAVLLRKGMRAVSVPITPISGAGGFILPGDFVDVILTTNVIRENLFEPNTKEKAERPALQSYLELRSFAQDNKQNGKKLEKEKGIITKDNAENNPENNAIVVKPETINKILNHEKEEATLIKKIAKEEELLVANSSEVSELMLENVRVLAIDQSVANNTNPEKNNTTSLVGTTATLEVTPEQAKLLAWSASGGKLTLSLRSFSESNVDEDGLEVNQRLPITRTSFAWPIQKILNKNENKDTHVPTPAIEPKEQPASTNLELIRNGRISIFNNLPQADTNSGGTYVKR
jgi:Flp pilus assembly protein CpaB